MAPKSGRTLDSRRHTPRASRCQRLLVLAGLKANGSGQTWNKELQEWAEGMGQVPVRHVLEH